MLEPTRLDRAVHPALFWRARLPPPSAGARVLSFADRARARCASDGLVALVIERVVRDIVGADVIPDLVLGPIGQRRDLNDPAVVVIDFDLADIRASRPLVATQAGHPCT